MSARRPLVIAYGIACHGLFALAVTAMVCGLYRGMQLGRGRVTPSLAWLADLALVAQLIALHSALLTRRGQRVLARLAPSHGRWKEARFTRLYGDQFTRYRASVPYLVPRWRRR